MNRALDHDQKLISSSLSKETQRQQDSQLSIIDRKSRIADLQNTNEDGVIETCFEAVKNELKLRQEALVEAEDEEDKARKVGLSIQYNSIIIFIIICYY